MDTEKTAKAEEAQTTARQDTSQGVLIDADCIETQYGRTQRGLSPRHVQLMAIGGAIGVGLFVGVGAVMTKTGPLSLLLGYSFWCLLFVWPTNLCLAEMCSYLPLNASIFQLASRFIDPAVGFAMGWTYLFASIMLVCVEYSAVATVMSYWLPDVNPAAWVAMAMVTCILLNVVAVKYYGESEFIMASLKILLLVGLVFLTLITMCGGNPKHDAYGFRSWGDGRYMLPYYVDGLAVGRFLSWWKVVLYAAFSVAGPDIISITSGEIQNPRRTIPRVAKLVFWRLVGFYIIGILAIGIICRADDPRLLGAISSGAAGAAASPFVIGIQNLNIKGLPSLINFLILTSGLSCGNAYLYSSSRTLYGLARESKAPQFLVYCTKTGVPIWCVLSISLITCITFLVASNDGVEVFFWFVDLTTGGLVFTYIMMLATFLSWYRARKAQGLADGDLYYVAPWQPYTAILSLVIGLVVLLTLGFDVFYPFDIRGFITSYFCIPYTIFLFLGWKIAKRTSFVKPMAADFVTGKKEIDEDCRQWEEGGIEENWERILHEMSFGWRCWERIW